MAHENVVAVGIDGSERSETALTWAIEQAQRRNARLHVVTSYELPTYTAHTFEGAATSLDSRLFEAANEYLDAAVERGKKAGLETSSSLETGDPAAVLVELSKKVATVVIGSRGRGSFADRLLGTVSSAVPAHGYCPTVVVPEQSQGSCLPIRHIVVGVDGSEAANIALERAVWEAERWQAKLTAVATVNTSSIAWMPGAGYSVDVLDDVRTGLEIVVEKATEGYDIDVRTHALEGNPAALMAEFSTAVDLLVIGTRGRGGFAGLLLGSTSQAILHHSTCPVMVVPKRIRPGDDVPPTVTDVPWKRPE